MVALGGSARRGIGALCCALALTAPGLACRERQPAARGSSGAPGHATSPLRGVLPSRAARSDNFAALEEGAPRGDPLERLSPPDQPSQRLALSGDRFAWLDGDELHVSSWPELQEVTRFLSPDARNVVGLTGGGFLIAARDHVLRLSPRDVRPERFPHAPRIGPTRIIPSRLESTQFWLYYSGIPLVPRFDLGAPPRIASLPMLGWTELIAFDRRALLGLGDGSFVYTADDGLRRIDVEGRAEHLPSTELAGRIWALSRAARLDRVWAASEQHLYLVHVRERAEVIRRMELMPHPVALASDGSTAAVLSVERWQANAIALRVDIYTLDAPAPQVVRLDASVPERSDAGEPAFEPELLISEVAGMFAVNIFGLQVYDYRRSVRLYPAADLEKLAPRAQ